MKENKGIESESRVERMLCLREKIVEKGTQLAQFYNLHKDYPEEVLFSMKRRLGEEIELLKTRYLQVKEELNGYRTNEDEGLGDIIEQKSGWGGFD